MANAPIQLKKVTPGDVVAVPTGYVGFVAGSDGKFYAKDGSGAATEIGATNETEVQQLIDDSLQDYATSEDVQAAIAPVDSRASLLASTGALVRWDSDEGGLFRLSSDQVSATDNVFRIERDDETIIERIWDEVNFYAEWIPLGVQVGSWGVTNASVNGDKLTAAAHILPSGATLHLKREETYNLDFPIRMKGDLTIVGNGATIKRRDQRASLLTQNSNSGTSTVTVADASVFRVGMRAFVVKTSGALGGHAMANGTSVLFGSSGFLITNIVGNVVTLGGTLQQNCVIGNKLVALDSMMLSDDASARCVCTDTIWDGNNASHIDVLDWAAGYGISIPYGFFERCTFQNMPNECCTFGSGYLKSCIGKDLWGSFWHASAANDLELFGVKISDCKTTNTNTKNNGHDEGVITFSNRSIDIRIEDCVFDNSSGVRGQGVFGNMDTTSGIADNNFFARNVIAKHFGQIMLVTVTSGGADFENLHLDRCVFRDCKRLFIRGHNVTKGPQVDIVIISKCEFVNSWIDIREARNAVWSNNVYRWELLPGVYAGSSSTFAGLPSTRIGGSALAEGDVACLTATDGANTLGVYVRTSGAWVYNAAASEKLPDASVFGGVQFVDCGQVNMNGGSIAGPGMVANNKFAVGVIFQVARVQKTEAGDTTFAYMQLRISDVDIVNWQCGIGHRVDAWWAVAVPYDTFGWSFNDLNVYTIRDSNYPNLVGVDVPPGCVAKNVTVYASDTTTGSSASMIKLNGPIDATKYQGGSAIDCYVPICPGSSQAIRLGLTSDNARNKNCIAVGNVIAKSVALAGSHDSVQDNNTVISLAGMTSPTVPPWRPVGANESLY